MWPERQHDVIGCLSSGGGARPTSVSIVDVREKDIEISARRSSAKGLRRIMQMMLSKLSSQMVVTTLKTHVRCATQQLLALLGRFTGKIRDLHQSPIPWKIRSTASRSDESCFQEASIFCSHSSFSLPFSTELDSVSCQSARAVWR